MIIKLFLILDVRFKSNKLNDYRLKGGRFIVRIRRVKNCVKRADDKRGKVHNTISIHNRTELGHWKSDTVLGKRGTGCFGTHVERMTSFLTNFKIPDRKNDVLNKAIFCL